MASRRSLSILFFLLVTTTLRPWIAAGAEPSAGPPNLVLEGPRTGHRLAGLPRLDVWWCESGWKVGRTRPAPIKASRRQPLALSAARGESEAVQLVLRPEVDAELTGCEVEPHRKSEGLSVVVEEVAYVHVTQPTDPSCQPGWYPDPLPPLRLPLALRAGMNQPLWLTVRVGRDARPGDHALVLRLRTSLGALSVPLHLHVYDFALPEETHLNSALGLGTANINAYHRLTQPADREQVFEKYLANFAAHRISPYSFYGFAPIEVTFPGGGTQRHAVVDFTRFDQAAAKWLDAHHFSTFQLPLRGMGGGTFHERAPGQIEGFAEGTEEHTRWFRDYLGQVQRHLAEKGWLPKAFAYWFDEPDPKDYEFVVAGMRRLKDAAPGLRRMLTEQPEPALIGAVDIWCGLTPEWTPERVKACHDRGEEVWWYICTGPKAPYVTEFIDHPGTELRLWPWQSWQYGVTGLLIWSTTWWTSPQAFPPPELQDPWTDPMSYEAGYGQPVGKRSPWGNGDGRFLYPPRRDPAAAAEACLDGPINSIRWENLRDGMEDYEYLWLLRRAVEKAARQSPASLKVSGARALLEVPPEVSKDLTHFTTDPRLILLHRDRVARAIEELAR